MLQASLHSSSHPPHAFDALPSSATHQQTLFDDLPDDVLGFVVSGLTTKDVARMRLACKRLYTNRITRLAIPHLSIRQNPQSSIPHTPGSIVKRGSFPHQTSSSDNVPDVCFKSEVICIAVDLVVEGFLASKVDTIEDTAEEPRSKQAQRMAQCMRPSLNNDRDPEDNISARMARPAAVPTGMYRIPVRSTDYFDAELRCKFELVDADTHAPIRNAIDEVHISCKKKYLQTTHTTVHSVPLPTIVKFKLNHLTKGKNAVRVKVVGKPEVGPNSRFHGISLLCFSKPFHIFCDRRVSQNFIKGRMEKRVRSEV